MRSPVPGTRTIIIAAAANPKPPANSTRLGPNERTIPRLRQASAASTAEEFSKAPYSTNRFTANVLQTYYNHPSGNIGSGLVELVDPGQNDAAYIVVNGISNTVAVAVVEQHT